MGKKEIMMEYKLVAMEIIDVGNTKHYEHGDVLCGFSINQPIDPNVIDAFSMCGVDCCTEEDYKKNWQ